jgi:hypothetical protein
MFIDKPVCVTTNAELGNVFRLKLLQSTTPIENKLDKTLVHLQVFPGEFFKAILK